jgi:peptidyl-tRNA hydrolase, PTH1 family
VYPQLLTFIKLLPDEITVIHDDVDLEFGRVKHQKGASSAGHRGVEDIIQKLGTNEFWRYRIGVGRCPDGKIPTDEWVLMSLSSQELEKIKAEIKVLP